MNIRLRIDTLVETLRAQLEHGGLTYEEAVVTEDFLTVLEEAKARVLDDGRPHEARESAPQPRQR